MTSKAQSQTRKDPELAHCPVAATPARIAVAGMLAICAIGVSGCSVSTGATTNAPDSANATRQANKPKPEPKSTESRAVDTNVQSEVEKAEAEKRATLLQDAASALAETHNAVTALDKNDRKSAIAALERATGKLDVVVSRDKNLAFAPVAVSTTMLDLYTTPETVKGIVKETKDNLAKDRVQQARLLIQNLASEADINVTEIPLATYPAAIKAVVPLIDQGKINEAKAALYTALNTLVVETWVVPLPRVRAEALLAEANKLVNEKKDQEKDKVRSLLDDTRRQIQLAEALGYGTADSYKTLYSQLDDLEKKVSSGQSSSSLFDRFRQSIKNFKFSS
jgi:hypothetical protein